MCTKTSVVGRPTCFVGERTALANWGCHGQTRHRPVRLRLHFCRRGDSAVLAETRKPGCSGVSVHRERWWPYLCNWAPRWRSSSSSPTSVWSCPSCSAARFPLLLLGIGHRRTIGTGSCHAEWGSRSLCRETGSHVYGIAGPPPAPIELVLPCSSVSGTVGTSVEFTAVSAGWDVNFEAHSCALDVSGVAYCWGSNQHGELGTALQDAIVLRLDLRYCKPARYRLCPPTRANRVQAPAHAVGWRIQVRNDRGRTLPTPVRFGRAIASRTAGETIPLGNWGTLLPPRNGSQPAPVLAAAPLKFTS